MAVRRTAKLNITGETILAAASSAATKDPTTAKKAAAKRTPRKAQPVKQMKSDGTMSFATGEIKMNPVKKAAAKAPAKKVAEAAKKAPAKSAEPKQAQTFEQRDWTYLDDKDPSEQHEILAKEINRRTNLATGCPDCETEVPISPKQVQAVLAMFPHFQRSETNKKRSGYHALAPEIVEQRSVHMVLAHKDARDKIAARNAAAPAKKAPAKRVAKKTTASKK